MKKGSLNLSIQAIVIVVLGMTLLGLGLGFVRTQFQQISDIGTEVQEQVREQIIAQLRTSGEQVSFPRSVQFSRGKQKVITLGVQNVGSQELKFKLLLAFDDVNSDPGYDDFNLRWIQDCLTLLPAESEVYGINVRAPRIPGTFALKATVMQDPDGECSVADSPGPNQYASKLSFITVG
jgi:hypothetical protein